MKKKKPSVRTSINIKPIFLEAMELVKKTKGVNKSSQVEFGLREYLREHRALLEQHKIDVWG